MPIIRQVEIECEVLAETEKAILIFDGKREVWIAKSMISDGCEEAGETKSIFIPEWLAIEKRLV